MGVKRFKNGFQLFYFQQRGRASTKIDRIDPWVLLNFGCTLFQFKCDSIQYAIHAGSIGAEVEIAVMACLLAKRDMYVDS